MSRRIKREIPEELDVQLRRIQKELTLLGFPSNLSLFKTGKIAARALEAKDFKVITINKHIKRRNAKPIYEFKL